MKDVWVRADRGGWESRKGRIVSAIELGADAVLVNEEDVGKVRELGRIKVAAFVRDAQSDADILVVGKNSEGDGSKPLPADINKSMDLSVLKGLGRRGACYVEIRGKEYERFVVKLAPFASHAIVSCKDWKVIPLENIIAELQSLGTKVIAEVKTSEDAKLALQTLEKGADGVLVDADDRATIRETLAIAKGSRYRVELIPAKVSSVRQVGIGDRVCVDTCSLLEKGEGMLVGSQSSGFFLVHAEVEESPYVEPRPFRVNAGAVHAYTLVGDKTKYLSELRAGDEVMITKCDGSCRSVVVGRVKIERRPLVLIEAETEVGVIKTFLQNAETIKLVSSDLTPISVTKLKPGDEVLVHLRKGARHFGIEIEEGIVER